MKRIKLVVAYDGTNYHGWQIQANGITIEEVLNSSLSKLLNEDICVIGASRTDSGVHSLGTVAVFDTNTAIPAEKISYALNQRLPEDIVIQSSSEVDIHFHPRKCNSIKTYEYRILNRRFPLPDKRLNTHFVYFPLDVEAMKTAAACLQGEHDFKSFCSAASLVEDTVRILYEATVEKEEDVITLKLAGNGFLMHMVRIIAGTLIKIGSGAWPPKKMKEILEARDRNTAGPKAPAKGLTLIDFQVLKDLEDQDSIKNEHWSYTVYQSEILAKGYAYIEIKRCTSRDFNHTVERLVRHAIQNGAKEVFVTDHDLRISDGGNIGPYTFQTAEEVEGNSCLQNECKCFRDLIWYKTEDYF